MKVAIIVCVFGTLWSIALATFPLSISQCTSSGCTLQSTSAVEDAAYQGQASGISSDGTTLTLDGDYRMYLLDTSGSTYKGFNLMNQELSFDVDMSGVPCGSNAALYLVSMGLSGGASGTGYCDAQGNPGCNEMDIWEANKYAEAYTTHPCQSGACDKNGCQYNPYRSDHSYYGPGLQVDTNSKFTVVTQFLTSDGTATGTLSEIKQIFYQNGKMFVKSQDITQSYCGNANNGGLAQMGVALQNQMVLTFSLWDAGSGMSWLDGGNNGPCTSYPSSSAPPGVVKFGNIKYGSIGSTTSSSTTTQKPTSAPTAKATSAPTAKATSAPTTKPATTAPTTKPPTNAPTSSPSGCTAANIAIVQSAGSSWPSGGVTITQYGVTIQSSCTSKTLVALTLTPSPTWSPYGSWGVTASGNSLTFPNYLSVTPSSPYTGFGYQASGEYSFAISSFTFQ